MKKGLATVSVLIALALLVLIFRFDRQPNEGETTGGGETSRTPKVQVEPILKAQSAEPKEIEISGDPSSKAMDLAFNAKPALSDSDIAQQIDLFRTYDKEGWEEWIHGEFADGLGEIARIQENALSLTEAFGNHPVWTSDDNEFVCSGSVCRVDFAKPLNKSKLRLAIENGEVQLTDLIFYDRFFGLERPTGRKLRVYLIRRDIDVSDVPDYIDYRQ